MIHIILRAFNRETLNIQNIKHIFIYINEQNFK